jgi:hypothetical protein
MILDALKVLASFSLVEANPTGHGDISGRTKCEDRLITQTTITGVKVF